MFAKRKGATGEELRVTGTGCWLLISCLLILTLGTGCRLIRGVAKAPGQVVRTITTDKPDKDAVDPVEVQQTLLRFADDFTASMTVCVDKLQRGTNALARAEVLQWKIALGTETCSIASEPNAVANLLDMTVFVTVTRTALEEHWLPDVFGESARPMLDSCRNAETNIWGLAGKVLNPEQQTELRSAITAWCRQNPLPESVLAARAVDFASQVAQANKSDSAELDSVFNLLALDPLSGLDPATREIAQTRLLAERALFVTQKMPMLLRWQTELLSINAVDQPAVQQLVTNSTKLTVSVKEFNRIAEQWPGQFSPVLQQAETGGKEIVDDAFWKGIFLLISALLAALLYRWLSVRQASGVRITTKLP
jgi:hypothetical protein